MSGLRGWADEEFGGANLGDSRRNERAVRLAAAMAGRPDGRVTSVLQDSAQREGAFRLLRNRAVDEAALAHSSHRATLRRLNSNEDFIVAVDQTGLTVTDELNRKGFGRAGSNDKERVRGLQAMSALALRLDGSCVGLCGQSWWRRSDRPKPHWKDDRRPLSERESFLWHQVIDQTQRLVEEFGGTRRAWYQLDRGADSFHMLAKARDENLLLTVRAAYDRVLAGDGGSMKDLVSASKVRGGIVHYLRPGSARRAGHDPKRGRRLSVRAVPIRIQLNEYRPQRTRTEMDLWVVHVREKRPPQGCERLEWFLLTTRSIQSKRDALNVAEAYCFRWRIEEFHKTWKSGACNLESSQLRSPKTFKCWATLHAAVASRIERFKHVSRTSPEVSALEIASRTEIDAAILLTERCKWKPGDELTAEQFVRLVADLGGYTGKSSGGPPGSIVIRRGFDQIETSARTLQALAARKM